MQGYTKTRTPNKALSPHLRVPPQSIDSEKALLGSVMLRPESMHDVVEMLRPESFYAEKHALIFEAMFRLFTKTDPIDLLSVTNELKDKKQLDKVGGRSYLTELSNAVPSSSNVMYYAGIVNRKHMLRHLIETSDEIAARCYEEPEEIEELLDDIEKSVFSATNLSQFKKFVQIGGILDEAFERIDKLHGSDESLRGVPSGFTALDNMLAGFQKSDLIILAARPSMGKTSLALDIARQAAKTHNIPVGLFSLEMSSGQLVDRMLASEAQVDAWKLRTGNIKSDEEFLRLSDALSRLSKAPIFIDDQANHTVLQIRSVARQMKSKHGLGMIIIDYLQLLTPVRPSDSTVQQVTEISRALKGLARELDVPVLALSQLSRAVEHRGGRPRLSDLRDSGSIEQDADVVMFIHREDKYNEDSDRKNIAEILVEKHRNGPTGKVELYFDEKKTTFLNLDKTGRDFEGNFDDF
jgi:replicative DNA helicase